MFPRALRLLVAPAFLALSACQTTPACPPKGPCEPTVEGAAGGAYADFDAAKKAFTRTSKDGSLTATLEDVAWLRFEGDEDLLVQKHRAYFEQGYTTFEMLSLTKDFVQPTSEVYVLTDSSGARVTARPITYQGAMGQEQERYAARYSVSFRHAITRDLAWIRLQRPGDGTTLQWDFPAGGGAPIAAAPEGAVPPPLECAPADPFPRPQPLLHPRNPAPGAASAHDPAARPVNLATPAPAASAVPPPAPRPAQPPEPTPPPADGSAALGTAPTGELPPPESRKVAR